MTRSTVTTGALAVAVAPHAQPAETAGGRFDYGVRADFFAGFRGDAERLARGMTLCEDLLAANPDHADALVWHGTGLMFLAGEVAALVERHHRAGRGAERGGAEDE